MHLIDISIIILCFRFWVPGPDGDYLNNLKYLRGFTEIQDLIDRSFMRLKENSAKFEEVGVYTQQFPYPCYIRDK